MDMVEVLNRGNRIVAEHDSPAALVRSAELVLDALADYPGYGVVAVSAAAERVLGAMMVKSPAVRVGGTGDLLIFDVNIASGTLLARAADHLRRAGHAGAIVAVAVHALCEEVPTSIRGTDGLVLLDRSGVCHEGTEGRDSRLLVAF